MNAKRGIDSQPCVTCLNIVYECKHDRHEKVSADDARHFEA